MNSNILVTASALSDQDLLARLETLAGKEREASVELVAHLAALDSRPALFLAQGYSSLFSYCTQALRLSEDAACNRIEAARACRRFPLILELLASGSLTLTSVRLLGKHLTEENHQSVLAKARDRSRREIDVLIAALAPRPDIPSTVRKLPTATPLQSGGASSAMTSMPSTGASPAMTSLPFAAGAAIDPPPSPLPATPRPIVQAWAPERYRVQFTIGQETHEKLRRLQELLRREIPNGDPGAIFDRALTMLLDKVEKAKLGAADNPRPNRSIRPETDKEARKPTVHSRHIPREVQRAVWRRDKGQCAFVSSTGRRCMERTFLEFHHIQPYAKQGPPTVANISLRCWRHNQYEAALIFGPHDPSIVHEARPSFGPARSGPSRTIKS
jgi:5-methylcytosine-specific restriction endonuclease McrA